MWNGSILLDHLPAEWRAADGTLYSLDTDFRIGIQLCLIQEDPELTEKEKSIKIQELLFIDDIPGDTYEIEQCVKFFINGWYLDNESKKKENKRLMDFNIDQWRIYSAFLAQYRIDLHEIEYMHFWKFMGLLSNLQECSYTRVIDIRQRKIKPKMDAEDKKILKEAKEIYELPELRSLEEQEIDDGIYDFLGGSMSAAEKKRVAEFEKYADIKDEE